MDFHILNISDTHGGNRHGLMSPDTVLTTEGAEGKPFTFTPEMTPYQEWMWQDVYLWGIEQAIKMTAGRPVIVIHAGDVTHGNRFTESLVSSRMSHQIAIAVRALAELNRVKPVRFFLVHGTDVHVFGEGTAEEEVAERLRGVMGCEVAATPFGLLDIGGVKVDIAHHGPGPGVGWLQGNTARNYAKQHMMDEIFKLHRLPPDIYIRGHNHAYRYERVELDDGIVSHLILCPSFCSMNGYARAVTRSIPWITNGMVLIDIQGGMVTDVHPLTKTIDIREHFKVTI